jgi:hypothetical protein
VGTASSRTRLESGEPLVDLEVEMAQRLVCRRRIWEAPAVTSRWLTSVILLSTVAVVAISFVGCQTLSPPPTLAPIPAVPYIPFADGRNYVLSEPLSYTIENTGVNITVPAGFVTDWASTPRLIWSVLPPFGTYLKPAVIHDYLYWMQYCTREQSDKILLIAMAESGVSKREQRAVYDGVRIGGQAAWDENARDRHAGLTKFVVADSSRKIALNPEETWKHYRSTHWQSLLDRKSPGVPDFCSIAGRIPVT